MLSQAIMAASPFPAMRTLARDAVALALGSADKLVSFGYELAKINRNTSAWYRPNTSANAETYAAGEIPGNSAHDLCRNNPTATRARQVVTSRVIGRGMTPIARQEWLALFEAWAPHCYSHNRSNFARVQSLVQDAIAESGEVIGRRRWRRVEDKGWNGLPLALPFQIQLIEAAQIDRLKDGPAPNNGKYVQGVEYNALDRPIAIWILPEHPGDIWVSSASSCVSTPVPYEDLFHIYREDRPGQARGVTWYAATGTAIQKLGTFENTELTRKNFEACTVNYIYNENGEPERDELGRLLNPAVKDSQGRLIEKAAPGQNVYVPQGYKVMPNTPQPVQGYAEFMGEGEQHVAQGWGIPYYALSGNLKSVSFSAARIGDVETRTWVYPYQEQVIVPLFLSVVGQWITEAGIATRKLRGTVADWPVEWQAPAVEEHDRVAAVDADEREVRGGFTTLTERQRARGWKPKKLMDERQLEVEDAADRKLKFDSDPNTTTRAGAIQTAPQNDPTQSNAK